MVQDTETLSTHGTLLQKQSFRGSLVDVLYCNLESVLVRKTRNKEEICLLQKVSGSRHFVPVFFRKLFKNKTCRRLPPVTESDIQLPQMIRKLDGESPQLLKLKRFLFDTKTVCLNIIQAVIFTN